MSRNLDSLVLDTTFESHVTVACPDAKTYDAFAQACAARGVKLIYIELPAGTYSRQLMTGAFHRGTYEDALHALNDLSDYFAQQGFVVQRRKLETLILRERTNPYVPQTTSESDPSLYFEFHVKVTEPDGALEHICRMHDAHLSRSISSRQNGRPQKFVTTRHYGVSLAEAQARADDLLHDLRRQGYTLSNILREYTLFDDNRGLDGTWAAPTIADCYQACGRCAVIDQNIL